MNVRNATTDDIPWLLDQLEQFAQFFGSSHSLFPSQDKAEETLQQIIANHPFVVAEQDESPVGFICGALLPHPYNADLIVLNEMFWWVAEEYRGSRAGLVLLNEFIAIGRRHAHWVVMTLEADSPINPETLYRRGFRPKETNYLLEVAA